MENVILIYFAAAEMPCPASHTAGNAVLCRTLVKHSYGTVLLRTSWKASSFDIAAAEALFQMVGLSYCLDSTPQCHAY
jgi:hypothetical protein